MLQYLDPVPFAIDSHMGFSETQGMLSCDGENLLIEFRVVDALVGMLKTSMATVKVPLGDVRSITYQKRFLGLTACIMLSSRNQRALASLPESRMGTIRLAVKRADRDIAATFCQAVQETAMRYRSQMLMDNLARLEEGDGI